jgi:hypothetical protein
MTEGKNSPWGLDIMEAEDKAHNEKTKELQDELNKQYSICFSTPSGKKVLDHLRLCTLDQPTWIPNPNNGESAVHYGFVREGQNSIVRNIVDRINSIKNK